MKVKAIEVNAKCSYITKGKVYEVQKPTANKFCYIVDDEGDSIFVHCRGYEECGHGVKWEIIE